ncbi:lipase secretion chaperone [Maricurvus nonylphenolicus]|uniref:lipase secretion chaperone n=1 Tax=Maricurvus nonylphenolicus TaxID=1008307 RepID=UPI0036F3781C
MNKKAATGTVVALIVTAVLYLSWYLSWQDSPLQKDTFSGIRPELPKATNITLPESALQPIPEKLTTEQKPDIDQVMDYLQSIPSLEGSEIDGALEIDDDGQLIKDKDVKYLFDYFLSATGEISQDQVSQLLSLYAEASLPSEAASEAITLFATYLDMKHALEQRMQNQLPQGYSLDNITQFFDLRNQIRQAHLGPQVTQAFYGDEIAYDRYQIDKARWQTNNVSDNPISPELSHRDQEQQRQHQLFSSSSATGNQLTPSEQYALWERTLGHEYAASRLAIEARLQQQRAEWRFRVTHYQQQLQTITQSSLSNTDQTQAILDLQARLFSPSEIPRLKAKAL